MAGVEFLVAEVGKMRAGDLQDVRAMLGQRAGAGRAGEHARQVEHADTGKRAVAGWQFLRRAVADPHDLHQRQCRDGGRLRMPRPFCLVRTMPPAPLAAMIASSRSAAFQVATARATASRSSATPSTLSAAARWFGKLQWR